MRGGAGMQHRSPHRDLSKLIDSVDSIRLARASSTPGSSNVTAPPTAVASLGAPAPRSRPLPDRARAAAVAAAPTRPRRRSGRPRARRIARVQVVERVGDDVRDREVPEPLAVGRDHVPRRRVGRAALEHVLVRRRCSRPRACAPRGRRAGTSSASSGRRAGPGSRAFCSSRIDVQEELEDRRPLVGRAAARTR